MLCVSSSLLYAQLLALVLRKILCISATPEVGVSVGNNRSEQQGPGVE